MSQEPEIPSTPVAPGDVLAGKYRVERVLGAGGMGVVVAATHLELDELVAVKFLLAEVMRNPEAAARFVREARAAVKIKSEHVARVIDVGRLENGAPYMVMEYLRGQDLSAVVQAGPLPIEDAVDYLIQACDAMAEAHAAGIVHRDLKPANLFLTQRSDGGNTVKVLDFGISKLQGLEREDASLTKTSTMMGSPYYMSPEQMRSARDVDHRTDIWSLGTILFELLTARPPFLGDSLPELLTKIMADAPASLCELRPDAPPELEAIVLRCLQKARDARYADVGELARALLPFGRPRSRYTVERVLKLAKTGDLPTAPAAPPPSAQEEGQPPAARTADAGGRTATSWAETGPTPGAKRRRAPVVILASFATVGVMAIVGAAVLRSRDGSSVEPPSSATSAMVVTPPVGRPEAPLPSGARAAEVDVAPAPAPQVSVAEEAPVAPPVASAAPTPPKSPPQRAAVTRRESPVRPPPSVSVVERPAPPPAPEPPPAPPENKTRRNPLAIELK